MRKWLAKRIAGFILDVQNQLHEIRRARARAYLKKSCPDDEIVKNFDTLH